MYRADGPIEYFGSVVSTALAAGTNFRSALADAHKGDFVRLGPIRYDVGKATLYTPADVMWGGCGPALTRVQCQMAGSVEPGCAFEFLANGHIMDVTLDNNCPVDMQGETVGNGSNQLVPPDNSVGELTNVWAYGRGFVFYNWGNGRGFMLKLRRCRGYGGRWLLCCHRSSGENACFIDADGLELYGDSKLSTYQGAVGNRLLGLGIGGGEVSLRNVYMELQAASGIEYSYGIFKDPEGYAGAKVDLMNVHVRYRHAVGVKHDYIGGSFSGTDINEVGSSYNPMM